MRNQNISAVGLVRRQKIEGTILQIGTMRKGRKKEKDGGRKMEKGKSGIAEGEG